MFGITFDKIFWILVIGVFLIGPTRLPAVAERFGRFVRSARDMAYSARDRMRDEMGPEFDDVDWRKLDPRKYDPRRIIREALAEAPTPRPTVAADSTAVDAVPADSGESDGAPVAGIAPVVAVVHEPAPFDSEAT